MGEVWKRAQNEKEKSLIDERGDRSWISIGKNRRQTMSEIVDNFNQHTPPPASKKGVI